MFEKTKKKKKIREMSQIKGTKEACLLNTMHGPRLDTGGERAKEPSWDNRWIAVLRSVLSFLILITALLLCKRMLLFLEDTCGSI